MVSLLLDVAKKIAEEAKREVALYQNFECNCPSTRQELKTNAEEGGSRITETTSKIEAGEGTVVELKIVIKVSQESCAEAKRPWQAQELWMRGCVSEPHRFYHPQDPHECGKGFGKCSFHVVVLLER